MLIFFSYGFEHLCKIRRDDLTMEALILSLDYRDQIFSTREIATANERLAAARQLYPPHSLQAAFGYSNRGSHDGSKNVRPTYSIL